MRNRQLLFFLLICTRLQAQVSGYVDPFIGATTAHNDVGGLGKTFPGATTPFGLVQVSPNTITGGDNGNGYSYEHTSIEGFAFTQMSGVGWYGDLGNFLVTPTTGPLQTFAGTLQDPGKGYRSLYSKKDEQASPGYYAATLLKYHVRAEATAAPHSGILRLTFPSGTRPRIQIDLARRVGGTSVRQYVHVADDHTIEGWMQCTPDGGGWGDGGGDARYTVYFYAQFSEPMIAHGVWSADIPDGWKRHWEDVESARYQDRVAHARVIPDTSAMEGKHLGFYAGFTVGDRRPILLKAGISFVSIEDAKANLQAEIAHWDFDAVHARARALWETALQKIIVEGGTKADKCIFYTALYHTMIDPRSFADINGRFPGGDGKPHQSNNYTKRTIFSGWDVFRSQFPLQTLINPRVVSDMINSLVTLAQENGTRYLERWEFLNAYSGCMVGNPAVSVLADAYAKGIRTFNIDTAYAYALNTCERFGNGDKGYAPGSISETLEFAYDEWCLSRLAAALGKTADSAKYARRALSYKNIYDPEKHSFRPKEANGQWTPWPAKGRLAQDYGCAESNPYQQGWFVPQDVDGLAQLMGGKEKAIADLVNFFQHTPETMMWNSYYNHANEPVHHIAFLFNRLGAPWLTQYWSRAICRRAYHDNVEGLVGNDDVGQMSAWYILASIGLYPLCPGDNRFEITSPVFNKATIHLDSAYTSGRTFTVQTVNNSPRNLYIQNATLNGKQYNRSWLDYADIAAGGTLVLYMGPQPNKHTWNIINHAQ
jgi:predicted alpha-1,2-mannosidase